MNNLTSRTITGGIMTIIGLVLIVISPFTLFATLIYGIPLFILGLIIFFNKKEDVIEKIKFQGGKKPK